MKFDPTYDYSSEDLRLEENLIHWKFAELIKTLLIMAGTAGDKIEIVGFGSTTEGLADNFNTYFSSTVDCYKSNRLLNDAIIEKLNDLNTFLGEKRKDSNSPFWDDFMLDKNSDWEIVRFKAKTILLLLKYDNLEIKKSDLSKKEAAEEIKYIIVEKTSKQTKRKKYNT